MIVIIVIKENTYSLELLEEILSTNGRDLVTYLLLIMMGPTMKNVNIVIINDQEMYGPDQLLEMV